MMVNQLLLLSYGPKLLNKMVRKTTVLMTVNTSQSHQTKYASHLGPSSALWNQGHKSQYHHKARLLLCSIPSFSTHSPNIHLYSPKLSQSPFKPISSFFRPYFNMSKFTETNIQLESFLDEFQNIFSAILDAGSTGACPELLNFWEELHCLIVLSGPFASYKH